MNNQEVAINGEGEGSSKSNTKFEKDQIDISPYFDMKKKRSVFEGAECFSDRGFNVDDDEVNRRAGHVAVCHAGRVLVWGGYTSGPIDTHWDHGRHRYWRTDWFMVLDPVTCTWKGLRTESENCPPLTSGATAVVIGDIFYVFCGFAIHFPEDYVLPTINYNVKEGTHPLLVDISSAVAEGNTNEAYSCDLSARPCPKWKKLNPSSIGTLPLPCDKLSSFVYKYKVYLLGGYGPQPEPDVHLKLPLTTSWIMDPGPGNEYERIGRGWNNQLVIYDPYANAYTWPQVRGKIPSPRAAHAMAVDTTLGIAYLFGGRFGANRTNDLYELYLSDMRWVLVHGTLDDRFVDAVQRPSGRTWHSLNLIHADDSYNVNAPGSEKHLKSQILLFGGYSNSEETLYDCWLLDPNKDDIERKEEFTHHFGTVTKRWTRFQHLEQGPKYGRRMWHCGVTLPHGIMIIGGYGTNLPISRPDVDHPSNVIDTVLSPRPLYRLALDATCQAFYSPECLSRYSEICNPKISNNAEISPMEDDGGQEIDVISTIVPHLVLKDIQKRHPKYEYDIALKEIHERSSVYENIQDLLHEGR